MSTTTVVCFTEFSASKQARYAVTVSALLMTLSLLLVAYYGAFSQMIAATVLLPLVLVLSYQLSGKIARYHGQLVLLDSNQITLWHNQQCLQGALCLPIMTTDFAILMRFKGEQGKHWCLIMSDAVAPAEFRLLSAMLHQVKRPL
ncbi:hypothetical protein IC617_11185 [Neiella sp. HB171785]|uniref:Toxin CptA n=1 Tax=Neiella litorisoli TaxID=2771431 RepID=A0A8J6QJ90_9GAMM|nr:protein YgfX [Neiella litorisoli]MBD1389993.1 hypothetical protein [Neiella litorisoli]